jgi:membrane fusion protein, multidrug efflux system
MAAIEGRQSPAKGEHAPPVAEDKPARARAGDVKPQSAPPTDGENRARRRRPFIIALVAVVVLAGLVAGAVWWLNARQYESTDDAFIDTRTVQVSAEVAGAITDVSVTDNQFVNAGTALVRIDRRNYQAALDQAKAQLEVVRANVANLGAQIDAQQAKIDQAHKQVAEAQAALTYSEQQNQRAQALVKNGSGTVQQSQQAASDLMQKQAVFAGAQANAVAAEKQLTVLRTQQKSAAAEVDAAKAALAKAGTDLDRTVIKAPVAGRIAKLTAAKGGYAQPGEALMVVVPRAVWVTANFKETQLVDMRPGQPVDIVIDAYPGRVFHGRVDSIQAGSGTAFSLLPPENATGNFVKVVQRVPVKIVFDKPPGVYLGPGMSVEPAVKVR